MVVERRKDIWSERKNQISGKSRCGGDGEEVNL